jgi:hypothetical protein
MSVSMIQASFQFGEVSPLLHARVDSPIYYRAVRRLRNMLVIPQGGAERRFGTIYVDQINDHAGSPVYLTDFRLVRPFIFDYEDGSKYLLIFRNGAIDVYYNNVYQSSVSTTYSAANIPLLSIAQSSNIVFIVIGDKRPATLIRASTGPIVLTLTASPAFTPYPTFDFLQNYDAMTFGVFIAGVGITTAQNLLGQPVDLISSAPVFNANHAGGLFFADGGTLRLDTYVSTTKMSGRILTTFDPASALFYGSQAIQGSESVLTEVAFSDVRGWPQRVSFFQNRLFFGRTQSLLGGLWGSNYNGYKYNAFNFDDSEALDTNAISTTLQGGKATLIENIVAFKTLLVFTTSGLYSSPLIIDLPLTPSNISFLNLQTSDSSSSVVPLVFDNDVVFFDKGGRKVKNVNVYATTQHYESKVISVLSPHLVNQPYSAAVFENSPLKDGSWLFMVNTGGDINGGLSIYQSVPEQEIAAWSLAHAANTVDGESYFRHVVSNDEISYFIIERVVDGNTRLFIEQLSFDAFMDCSKIGTQALGTTISGLDYLEGEYVVVRGLTDGATRQSVVSVEDPVTGGSITLAEAVTAYQVGLFWSPELVPLPLNVPLQSGNTLYMPKSIKNIYVDLFESLGVYVNGVPIPEYQTNGVDYYNDGPVVKTGAVKIEPMTGWAPNAEISITQIEPFPMTVLGIDFSVTI